MQLVVNGADVEVDDGHAKTPLLGCSATSSTCAA